MCSLCIRDGLRSGHGGGGGLGPLAWSIRIAARYVPEDRVAEFGARNDAPGELLVRLHIREVIAQADLAG